VPQAVEMVLKIMIAKGLTLDDAKQIMAQPVA
jgi:hypothetical protein